MIKERAISYLRRKEKATEDLLDRATHFEGCSLDEKFFSFPECSEPLGNNFKKHRQKTPHGTLCCLFFDPIKRYNCKTGQDCKAPFNFKGFFWSKLKKIQVYF